MVMEVADNTDMLTVWFSLLDAPVEAGCLKVIPGSHTQGLVTHCPNNGAAIPDKLLDLEREIKVPTKKGDVLFLHRRTQHASLENVSDKIRWSFDLRYNPIGQPTGREVFPGFVARSRSHPESELHDATRWADLWLEARARLAAANYNEPFDRWNANDAACA